MTPCLAKHEYFAVAVARTTTDGDH